MTEYKFFLSCDVNLPVRVKMCVISPSFLIRISASIEGSRPRPSLSELLQELSDTDAPPPYGWEWDPNATTQGDLFVECQLYVDGKATGLPLYTTYHTFTSKCSWDEWISLPIKYQDLPLSSQLGLTVWDAFAPRKMVAVGGSTIRLFGANGVLQKGLHGLRLHSGVRADGLPGTSTPGQVAATDEFGRLENLIGAYDRGEMHRVPWLDKLVFREIERQNQSTKIEEANRLTLFVELPVFEHPVLFHEPECNPPAPSDIASQSSLMVVFDPESARENPVELKHRKLARSLRRGVADRELKPNPAERRQIAVILAHPATKHLSAEEKDLMWKFRYSLIREKKALTKFLKCIDWSDVQEAEQAAGLLKKWVPIDIDDALELLSALFTSEAVREYAVSRLEAADDDEIMSYLLQLVNALRYERGGAVSPLSNFLVTRAVANAELGNFFHWYLTVAMEDKRYTSLFLKVYDAYSLKLLDVEGGTERLETYARQGEMIAKLVNTIKEMRTRSEPRPKKVQYLREQLSAQGQLKLDSFATMPLPLDATISVIGIENSNATIFKSARNPLLLHFHVDPPVRPYAIIFKSGDDLRQDQLVISIIQLMDRLLKKESLDLKLTPFRVLATSSIDGMVEFVYHSKVLAELLAKGDLLTWLRSFHPSPDSPLGLEPEVLDTYLRSCAGYCIITFILGVGDRHLDNLMLCETGQLFHIDFGYLLGRDPKPFPPPIKLTLEMVEAMGGASSPHYMLFKTYCCEAYNILRKSSNLILNLLSLMADASIPDLSGDPEKAILKVQEKFRLDLTDEEAVQYIQSLINDSVSALFPQVIETIHRWAQYWRS